MKLRSWSSAAMLVAVVVVTLVITLWPGAVDQEVGTIEQPGGAVDPATETSANAAAATSAGPEPSVAGPLASTSSTTRQTFGGEVREVGTLGEWEQAVASAQPGDEIRLVSTINAVLPYRADLGAPSGTPSSPIVITAEPGAWIDPGDQDNGKPALDIRAVRHVWVDGVQVRGSQFGIRFLGAGGSTEAPARVQNSVVTDIGDACVHLGADPDNWQVTSYVLVESNDISRCGSVSPRFGEGVYIGYGKTQWIDESHDITVRGNEIYDLGSEALDIKTGSRNVIVEDNFIHDVGGIRGGVISAHYAVDPNPSPDELDLIVIRRNRIWNVNLDNRPESNDWAIWVGHGGIQVTENRIWNLRDVSAARAIRVRAEADFGPHPITISDNVLWSNVGWEALGNPSGSHLVDANGNVGPAGSGGIEETFEPGVSIEGEARSSAEAAPGSVFDPILGSPSGPSEPIPVVPAGTTPSTVAGPPPSTTPAASPDGVGPAGGVPGGEPIPVVPAGTTPSTVAGSPRSTTPAASPGGVGPAGGGAGGEPISFAPAGGEPTSFVPAGTTPSTVVGLPQSTTAAVSPNGVGPDDGAAGESAGGEQAAFAPAGTTPSTGDGLPLSTTVAVSPDGVGPDDGDAESAVSEPTSPVPAETTSPEGEPPQSTTAAVSPDGSVADDSALIALDYGEDQGPTVGVIFVIVIIVTASLAVAARAIAAPMRGRG